MDAEQENNVASKGVALELSFEDGNRMVIKKAAITAVYGDAESSTIYFDGNSIQVKNPYEELLTILGAGKHIV